MARAHVVGHRDCAAVRRVADMGRALQPTVANNCQTQATLSLHFCKLPRNEEPTKRPMAPTPSRPAPAACAARSVVSVSGTTYTTAVAAARSSTAAVDSLPGVERSVAMLRAPSCSALDSRPRRSMLDSEKPDFSAA